MRLSRSHDSSFTTAAFVLAALLISIAVIKVRQQHHRSRTNASTGLLQCQHIQHSGNNELFTWRCCGGFGLQVDRMHKRLLWFMHKPFKRTELQSFRCERSAALRRAIKTSR